MRYYALACDYDGTGCSFLQIADGVDDETWLFHLRNGDDAGWFRDALNDDELARETEEVAARDDLAPREGRALIRKAVEARYCGPE